MPKKIDCDPGIKNACPVYQVIGICFTDRHHLMFPRRDVKGRFAKEQRASPDYQVDICRALHNAIHASGYQPEIPNPITGEDERKMQLVAGELALKNYMEHTHEKS